MHVNYMVLWVKIHHFEVLEHEGLHLVVTEVVPVGGGADKKRIFCAVQYLNEEGLRRVCSLVLLICL